MPDNVAEMVRFGRCLFLFKSTPFQRIRLNRKDFLPAKPASNWLTDGLLLACSGDFAQRKTAPVPAKTHSILRWSSITLPSFGKLPGATHSMAPPTLKTSRTDWANVSATPVKYDTQVIHQMANNLHLLLPLDGCRTIAHDSDTYSHWAVVFKRLGDLYVARLGFNGLVTEEVIA